MMNPGLLWAFGAVVGSSLAFDLLVRDRRGGGVTLREAALWSAAWIGAALLFALGIAHEAGRTKALEFLTGYVLEKSLSVDNLFVIVAVFRYFRVPTDHQPHVLKWGILGALGLRLAFILAGTALVSRFRWTLYFFGVLLVYTGFKMAFGEEKEVDGDKNPALVFLKRFIPIESAGTRSAFLIRRGGGWAGTPLLAALVVIEASDIIFAVDSIPAVLAISTDPFIVYTSNIFAILGLRSLYYLLAHMAGRFSRLKYGISGVLVLTGLKMLLADVVHVPVTAALAAVIVVLAASILASPDVPAGRRAG